jgi:CHASE2 domain-containing sensor protein
VQSILKSTSLPQIRNKIVLVGFVDPNHPDAFAIRSPFGELMPGVELQANLLASLLTGSEDRIVPIWLQTVLIGLGGILISHPIDLNQHQSPATIFNPLVQRACL